MNSLFLNAKFLFDPLSLGELNDRLEACSPEDISPLHLASTSPHSNSITVIDILNTMGAVLRTYMDITPEEASRCNASLDRLFLEYDLTDDELDILDIFRFNLSLYLNEALSCRDAYFSEGTFNSNASFDDATPRTDVTPFTYGMSKVLRAPIEALDHQSDPIVILQDPKTPQNNPDTSKKSFSDFASRLSADAAPFTPMNLSSGVNPTPSIFKSNGTSGSTFSFANVLDAAPFTPQGFTLPASQPKSHPIFDLTAGPSSLVHDDGDGENSPTVSPIRPRAKSKSPEKQEQRSPLSDISPSKLNAKDCRTPHTSPSKPKRPQFGDLDENTPSFSSKTLDLSGLNSATKSDSVVDSQQDAGQENPNNSILESPIKAATPMPPAPEKKKIQPKTPPFQFAKRVSMWQNLPKGTVLDAATFGPEYANSSARHQDLMINLHGFSSAADRFCHIGVAHPYTNLTTGLQDTQYSVPAEMDREKRSPLRGRAVWTVDVNQVCYHKFFHEKAAVQPVQDSINTTFFEADFPTLAKAQAQPASASKHPKGETMRIDGEKVIIGEDRVTIVNPKRNLRLVLFPTTDNTI